jgi:ABC-2 type transport system permease protein
MKRFKGFLIKEFRHIFRDYRTLLILFGMPVAQIMLFGFAITNEIKDANIAIFDQSHDYATEELTSKILSSGYFKLKENINSQDELDEAFKRGEIKEVIIFEPEFSERLERENKASVQILADASDPNLASQLINYTSSIVNDYRQSLAPEGAAPPSITAEVKMLYNPSLKSVYLFVPGLMAIILLLVSALMTSISITKEKELGTMEVLLVSPLKPYQIIIGKVIPYLLLAVMDMSIILLLAKFVFNVPVNGSLFLLIAESILFVITALSLGILISTISSNQQTAMMVSLGALMLPTIMLSGFIFPIDNMPLPLQVISNIIPARWYVIIIKGIMLKGVTFSYIQLETAILAGMTLIFLILSIKKFKVRLQ